MISLQKLITELNPASLNEIVGGKHGTRTHGKKTKTKKHTKTRTKSGKYY